VDRLAVVYLARHVNPPRFLRFFLASLRSAPAGADYDLIVIAKGCAADHAGLAPLRGFSAPGLRDIEIVTRPDDSFATPLFQEMGGLLPHDLLLFHVSWARVLAPGWARLMLRAFDAVPDAGMVGASAGWEALDATTPFPNPSLRTTGFMTPRALWRSLDFGDQSTKRGGNLFEAGPRSMTRQIEARGLAPILVGGDGRFWRPEDWHLSGTFRLGDQEKLIFADNRTQDYAAGSLKRRRKLARLNWGDPDLAAPNPLWRRLARRLAWRFGGR
jgi:hypothetical protein